MQLASAHVAAYMRSSWPVQLVQLAGAICSFPARPSQLACSLRPQQLARGCSRLHTLPSFWYNYTRIFTYCQKIHNQKVSCN